MPDPAPGAARGALPGARAGADAVGGAAAATPVLLTTSNGHGMGHLTRQLAVALAAHRTGAPITPSLLSMSLALPVVDGHGLRGEYCPGPDRGWLPHTDWHRYLRDRLRALVAETGARLVAFDGVVPYLGLQLARAALPDVAFVWFRRGLWVPGRGRAALAAAPFFDLVIEPGDLGAAADRGATAGRADATVVPPITMLDVLDRPSRAEAAAALGLDPDRPTALVMPGTGRLGQAADATRAAVRTLLEDPAWQVAVTRAHIARADLPDLDPARVRVLHGVYPLARYLAAVDLVVTAAGYNAVHEFLPAALPTLLVPAPNPSTDDQVGRARALAAEGLALVADPDRPADVAAGVRELLDPARRADLAAACAGLPAERRGGGGAAAAALLADLAAGFAGHTGSLGERLRVAELRARHAALRALGPTGAAVVRTALRRSPPPGPRRRVAVRLVEEPPPAPPADPSAADRRLLLTEHVTAERVSGGEPLEHLLPGSSPAYRERRRRLAAEHYRLLPPLP